MALWMLHMDAAGLVVAESVRDFMACITSA